MSRKKGNLLNVKSYIEYVIWSVNMMLEDNNKHGQNGLSMPPLYAANLFEVRFFGEAILRKHAKKNTRKDIYVEKKG